MLGFENGANRRVRFSVFFKISNRLEIALIEIAAYLGIYSTLGISHTLHL